MATPHDGATSSDLTRRAAPESPAFVGKLVLRTEDGAAALVLDDAAPQRLLVGRSPACALIVDDPLVSRRHVALEIVDGAAHLRDLGSTNGVLVDGVRVIEGLLRGGERLTVGDTTFLVERVAAGEGERGGVPAGFRFGRMFGKSREMRRLYPLCAKLAAAMIPVLIEGETGTGKEVLAEALHEEGPRKAKPFVVFDCTTVPANLMESELFGHERGAFTGATTAHVGLLEQADGGTLFIDEIGDLDLPLQAKLLRVIDKLEFRAVGSSRSRRADVRILAATRRDLDVEIAAGRFRDDLYHRLAVGRIELPPLRHRKGDLELLVAEICRQHGTTSAAIPAAVRERWEAESWPGNVRELRNAVARVLALGAEADVSVARSRPSVAPGAPMGALAQAIASILSTDLPLLTARQQVVDEFDRQYIEGVLAKHGGNVTRAAAASGIARRHFHRMLARAKTP